MKSKLYVIFLSLSVLFTGSVIANLASNVNYATIVQCCLFNITS